MVYARPSQQHPATEASINTLKPISYVPMQNSALDDCVICSQQFIENEPVIYLSCGSRHVFHDSCIKTWLRINAVCPICRHSLE